jgi:hypothetical protein
LYHGSDQISNKEMWQSEALLKERTVLLYVKDFSTQCQCNKQQKVFFLTEISLVNEDTRVKGKKDE